MAVSGVQPEGSGNIRDPSGLDRFEGQPHPVLLIRVQLQPEAVGVQELVGEENRGIGPEVVVPPIPSGANEAFGQEILRRKASDGDSRRPRTGSAGFQPDGPPQGVQIPLVPGDLEPVGALPLGPILHGQGLPGLIPYRSQLESLTGPDHALLVPLDLDSFQLDGGSARLQSDPELLARLELKGSEYTVAYPIRSALSV